MSLYVCVCVSRYLQDLVNTLRDERDRALEQLDRSVDRSQLQASSAMVADLRKALADRDAVARRLRTDTARANTTLSEHEDAELELRKEAETAREEASSLARQVSNLTRRLAAAQADKHELETDLRRCRLARQGEVDRAKAEFAAMQSEMQRYRASRQELHEHLTAELETLRTKLRQARVQGGAGDASLALVPGADDDDADGIVSLSELVGAVPTAAVASKKKGGKGKKGGKRGKKGGAKAPFGLAVHMEKGSGSPAVVDDRASLLVQLAQRDSLVSELQTKLLRLEQRLTSMTSRKRGRLGRRSASADPSSRYDQGQGGITKLRDLSPISQHSSDEGEDGGSGAGGAATAKKTSNTKRRAATATRRGQRGRTKSRGGSRSRSRSVSPRPAGSGHDKLLGLGIGSSTAVGVYKAAGVASGSGSDSEERLAAVMETRLVAAQTHTQLLTAKLTTARRRIGELEQALAASRRACAAAEKKATAAVSRRKKDASGDRERVRAAKAEVDDLTSRLKHVQSTWKSPEAWAKVKADITAAKAALRSAKEESTRRARLLEAAHKQVEELTAAAGEARSSKVVADAAKARRLAAVVRKKDEALRVVRAAATDNASEAAAASKEVDELRRKLRMAQADAAGRKNAVDALRARITTLEKQLEAAQDRVATVEELEDNIRRLRRQVGRKDLALRALQARVEKHAPDSGDGGAAGDGGGDGGDGDGGGNRGRSTARGRGGATRGRSASSGRSAASSATNRRRARTQSPPAPEGKASSGRLKREVATFRRRADALGAVVMSFLRTLTARTVQIHAELPRDGVVGAAGRGRGRSRSRSRGRRGAGADGVAATPLASLLNVSVQEATALLSSLEVSPRPASPGRDGAGSAPDGSVVAQVRELQWTPAQLKEWQQRLVAMASSAISRNRFRDLQALVVEAVRSHTRVAAAQAVFARARSTAAVSPSVRRTGRSPTRRSHAHTRTPGTETGGGGGDGGGDGGGTRAARGSFTSSQTSDGSAAQVGASAVAVAVAAFKARH